MAEKKRFKGIKKCCDPIELHKHKIQTNHLRKTNEKIIKKAEKLDIFLTVDDLICSTCKSKIKRGNVPNKAMRNDSDDQGDYQSDGSYPEQRKYSSDSSTGNDINLSDFVRKLNKIFGSTPVPEIDYKKLLKNKEYSTDMLNRIVKYLSKNVFKNADVNNDSDEMVSQLKEKFATASNRNDKIKILLVLPKSWSVVKISKEFQTTRYLAEQTKRLVEKDGILCSKVKKLGSKTLNSNTVKMVQDFYLDEDISRHCPGMRDYVTVNANSTEKVRIPRRLVMMNLSEAYALFKDKHPDVKVGFSKFAELRPQQCVLAMEKYGTHTTCVCQYHQNFELWFSGLKQIGIFREYGTYRDLLTDVLCSRTSDECRFGHCNTCFERIIETVKRVQYTLEDIILVESVSFKQWAKDDGRKCICI